MNQTRTKHHLDRISLDGCLLHRRSATLHASPADPRAPTGCRWWVDLACDRAPERLRAGATPMLLDARLVSGHPLRGTVTIASRTDDAFGTRLILGGVEPPDGLPAI